MILTSLELTDFRNYPDASVEFGERKNFLIGNNAQGKTNILEAIYLLCLSRSFRTSFEKEAVRFSQTNYTIKGIFKLDNGNIQNVIFHYSQEKGKQITINRKRLNRASELIGNFPVVLSSPDEYVITTGPPPGRRKFVDILLSQIYRKYFSYLQDYHRIIQQRNKILLNWKLSGVKTFSIIDTWDQRLVEVGSKIIEYRRHFAISFSEISSKIYSELVVDSEELTFEYRPNVTFDESKNIQIDFLNRLKQMRSQEIQRGTSLIGPHRDEFVFNINGQELRKYGSRGQHKTVLVSLAIAQFNIIKEKVQEVPIILIDDLYSEIDGERKNKIIEILNKMGQVFITSTSMHENNMLNKDDRYHLINEGQIKSIAN